MAKKNGQTGEEQSPVEQTRKADGPREDRHAKLRDGRRALELELATVDGQIRQAIADGDIEALGRLTPRKAELPGLFIVASTAETTARHEVSNAADKIKAAALESAMTERDKLEAALVKLQRDTEIQIAALKDKVAEANQEINTLYSEIAAARNFGAECDAAFKRSLASLAGI